MKVAPSLNQHLPLPGILEHLPLNRQQAQGLHHMTSHLHFTIVTRWFARDEHIALTIFLKQFSDTLMNITFHFA